MAAEARRYAESEAMITVRARVAKSSALTRMAKRRPLQGSATRAAGRRRLILRWRRPINIFISPRAGASVFKKHQAASLSRDARNDHQASRPPRRQCGASASWLPGRLSKATSRRRCHIPCRLASYLSSILRGRLRHDEGSGDRRRRRNRRVLATIGAGDGIRRRHALSYGKRGGVAPVMPRRFIIVIGRSSYGARNHFAAPSIREPRAARSTSGRHRGRRAG